MPQPRGDGESCKQTCREHYHVRCLLPANGQPVADWFSWCLFSPPGTPSAPSSLAECVHTDTYARRLPAWPLGIRVRTYRLVPFFAVLQRQPTASRVANTVLFGSSCEVMASIKTRQAPLHAKGRPATFTARDILIIMSSTGAGCCPVWWYLAAQTAWLASRCARLLGGLVGHT